MALQAKRIIRKFQYNGLVIPDPNPAASEELVVRSLANTYPELVNAKIEPVVESTGEKGETIHLFTIKVATGVKG